MKSIIFLFGIIGVVLATVWYILCGALVWSTFMDHYPPRKHEFIWFVVFIFAWPMAIPVLFYFIIIRKSKVIKGDQRY